MPPVPSSTRALLVAGMTGSLERAGASVTVVVPCAAPTEMHFHRRTDAPPRSRRFGPTSTRTEPVPIADGPLGEAAELTAGDPEVAANLLRSATFRAAALGAIELCEALDLDGKTARAMAPPGSDDASVQELARRMVLLTTVVRALTTRQQRARPHRAQSLPTPSSRRNLAPAPAPVAPSKPRATEGELVFFGPLHELVAMGLYRPAIEALCAGLREVAPAPIDRDYLLKILDEEVGRQFGHPLRPVVELVLNAVDAHHGAPPAEPPPVEVSVGPGSVSVSDQGAGMNLRTILSRLLIPFATDKRPGVDIGRFGVGFFSVLGFGLAHPESFSLRVCTSDAVEGWTITVIAGGPMADALLCAVRRGGPPSRGTQITVTSSLIDGDALRSYLKDALHFLPSSRALVRLDDVPINDGSLLCGGRLFEDVAAEGDPPLMARFQLGGRGLAGGISAATYHAGVKVESCLAMSELTLIDFPGAVELTEGRDALKPGPEFNAVAIAFHRRLVRLAGAADASRDLKERLAEIAAQVSSMLLQSAAWSAVAPELARELLGVDRYLVSPERVEAILGFLGSRVAPLLFVPESFWAEREWHSFMPGERELFDRELEIDPPEPLPALVQRRPDLLGLAILAERGASAGSFAVALARGRRDRARRAVGSMPCLGTRRAVLLREDSPVIARPRGWMDHYALRASFDRATGLREAEVERDIIVTDPIGRLGGCA